MPDEREIALGARLREARIASGKSQDELARDIGVGRSSLVRMETGERRVTATDLFALSDTLKLPLSHFVYDPLPTIASARDALTEEGSRADRAGYRADAHLQAFARDAEWLRQQSLVQPVSLPSLRAEDRDSARRAARTAREGQNLAGPLGSMVQVAEQFGLFIRVQRGMQTDGASLTPEPGFGVALVSGGQEPGRRRFTAAHELGHHLLGDDYSSDVGLSASRSDRERIIDAFAAELLLPERELLARWHELEAGGIGEQRERLIRVAGEFRISWSSTVDAALRMRLITQGHASQLRSRTPVRAEFMRSLGYEPAPDLAARTPGPVWSSAVLAAYERGLITRARTVELMAGSLAMNDIPDLSEDARP